MLESTDVILNHAVFMLLLVPVQVDMPPNIRIISLQVGVCTTQIWPEFVCFLKQYRCLEFLCKFTWSSDFMLDLKWQDEVYLYTYAH